jgi:hypothetical protein
VSGCNPRFSSQKDIGNIANDKESRLSVLSQLKLLLGPFETKLRNFETKSLISLHENFPGEGRKIIEILSHAYSL